MESNEVLTMRAMAWQRAKGELHAMLAIYWPQPSSGTASALDDMKARIDASVKEIEENL